MMWVKVSLLAVQTWSCLCLIVLSYIGNCCLIILIISSITVFLQQSVFSVVCCLLLGLFILLCERLIMLQHCGVVWDVLCQCVSRSGAALCLCFPFAIRRSRPSESRRAGAVFLAGGVAGSARRSAVELSGLCTWVEVSRTAIPGSSALSSHGAVWAGCGGPRWLLAGLSCSKSLFPTLMFCNSPPYLNVFSPLFPDTDIG